MRTSDLQKVAQWAKSNSAPSEVYNAACRLLDNLTTPSDDTEGGQVARFAADVARLVADYANEERGIVALTPFESTLDQLCLEKYGFDLDKVAALDTPDASAQATTEETNDEH